MSPPKSSTAGKRLEKRNSDASSAASTVEWTALTHERTGPLTREDVIRVQRPAPPATTGSKLKALVFQIDCVLGGKFINKGEMAVVYILLLSVVALCALGAYKQLSHLAAMLTAAPRELTTNQAGI